MTAGLQVINDSNILQLDSEYKNLEYKTKITMTVPAGDFGSLVTPGYTNEVIAVGYSSVPILLFGSGGNQWFVSTGLNALAPSVSVTFYIFGAPDPSVVAGGGFEIRDASGNVTFSSGRRYMDVRAFGQASSGAWLGAPPTTLVIASLPSSASYATVLSAPRAGWQLYPEGGSSATSHPIQDAIQTTTTGCLIRAWSYFFNHDADAGYQYQAIQRAGGQALVIDVTGL